MALALSFAAASVHPLRADGFYHSWTQEYLLGSDESQAAKAVAFDSRGNVIITGWADKVGTGQAGTNTAYTAKYDGNDGSLIWQKILSTTNDLTPTCITVDSNDAVIIAGSRNSTGIDDIFVMKYDAAGNAVGGFPVLYDGPAGGQDIASKVVVDSQNNIIVAGRSIGSGTQEDIVILKFSPTGASSGEDRLNSTNRKDFATALAVGPSDSIVTVGTVTNASSNPIFVIHKLTSGFADAFSPITINTGGRGGATGVAVNRTTGDIFATGVYSVGIDQGYYTVKYNSSGTFQWQAIVPPTDPVGTPVGIALGPDGHPVVTGYLRDPETDFFVGRTIKYDAADGDVIWENSDAGFGTVTPSRAGS